ncbi:sensor histidine kinase [Cellulomonas cellasea]|uniref:histidine kinase n=2 Tax=Cellulomonas cellasea TaxID=43670 RepID=A0A0A0BC06_9CELL|nr:histidine kinase [Cellulomonas cellasea]KGM03399.1 hypothetical protein Q760_03975 [Cellulomonas cellasea DSM 20118]GEA90234.1 hypothetical protein CCE01nite_41830 [Cellulomonas cellasea]
MGGPTRTTRLPVGGSPFNVARRRAADRAGTAAVAAVFVGVATMAAGTVTSWDWLSSAGPPYVLFHLIGALFLLAAATALVQRQPAVVALLLALVGVFWYVADLRSSTVPAVFALGFVLAYLPYAGLAHVALAAPFGRLWNRVDVAVVSCAYATAVGSQWVRLVVDDPPMPWYWSDSQPNTAAARTGSALAIVLTIIAAVRFVGRYRAAARGVRRPSATIWSIFAAASILWAATELASLLSADQRVQNALVIGAAALTGTAPAIYLASVTRSSWGSRRLAPLLTPGDRTGPAAMQHALAVALGDPGLRVAFRGPDGALLDVKDRPVPVHSPSEVVTPVLVRGEELAVLVHDPALATDPRFVASIVDVAALALENARLVALQREQLVELRASRRRLVEATDAERRRLERNLHDGVQQSLLGVLVLLNLAAETRTRAPAEGDALLARAAHEVSTALGEVQDLSRGVFPRVLTEQGLAGAVEVLAERSPVPVVVHVDDRRWPPELEVAGYFVISEGLANVLKHAEATVVVVNVTGSACELVVSVTDDGRGGAHPGSGTGLVGLRDRVGAVGGILEVSDARPSGTVVTARIPRVAAAEASR